MDGGAWWATIHGVTKSRTWLSDFPSFYSQHNVPLSGAIYGNFHAHILLKLFQYIEQLCLILYYKYKQQKWWKQHLNLAFPSFTEWEQPIEVAVEQRTYYLQVAMI